MQKHDEWLYVALQDLLAAQRLLKDDDRTLSPALFHTQQCAEKAFKAYLCFKQHQIKRTHDLADLIKDCSGFDDGFDNFLPYAFNLNPYLSESRYPDDCLFIPDRLSVEIAIKQAEEILEFVQSKIL